MFARRAVLLTASNSSHPSQLLFYKQRASVSPLFPTLTGRPQPTENTATLSPTECVFTKISPVKPLESAYTSQHRVLPCFDRTRSPATPLESAFTRPASVSSLESAFTENRGGGGALGPVCHYPSPISRSEILGSPLVTILQAKHANPRGFLHSILPKRKFPSFIFNHLRTILQLRGGGGGSHS
jgi:hypothetical protein